jgi:hypothetical protein
MGNCLAFLKAAPSRTPKVAQTQQNPIPTVVVHGDDESVQSTRSERLETPQPASEGPSQLEITGTPVPTFNESTSGTGVTQGNTVCHYAKV